jgi:hypothetical protein
MRLSSFSNKLKLVSVFELAEIKKQSVKKLDQPGVFEELEPELYVW